MGVFKKNSDPITGRSRELNAKISALESKIKKLSQELESSPGPRVRSTTFPENTADALPGTAKPPSNSEPIFEKVDQNPLKIPAEPSAPPSHVDELRPRKFDFASLWERIKKEFQGPPPANPKLVNYLAAGSVQGLRPLRYEKRVWRNRCVALATLLLLAIFGILYALEHRH